MRLSKPKILNNVEQMNFMSVLRLMPSVKEEIEVFSNNVINSIVNGDQSALEVD